MRFRDVLKGSGWCKNPGGTVLTYLRLKTDAPTIVGKRGIAWNGSSTWGITVGSNNQHYSNETLVAMLEEKGFFATGSTVLVEKTRSGTVFNIHGMVKQNLLHYCKVKVNGSLHEVNYEDIKPSIIPNTKEKSPSLSPEVVVIKEESSSAIKRLKKSPSYNFNFKIWEGKNKIKKLKIKRLNK